MADLEQRESWGSRWGLILAAAGNAVGIGNLLRFPGQAGQNGGGAFMIPYICSLLLFGLPMMWVAWTVGRMGGRKGHGSTPGMFEQLWRHPAAKYLGVLGIVLPLVFCLYYTYIESWCLGYSWFSLTGAFASTPGHTVHLGAFLDEYLGTTTTSAYFPGYSTTIVFALLTVVLNVWILYRGVAKGIELLAKIAMPALLLFCLILVVRVFSLGGGKGSVWDGLAFLWTPQLDVLAHAKVWIAAAGQIFFTLSIGFGSLECYASYLKDHDDLALTGLTTVAANEFVEVIFGSLIAIPACAVFFGAGQVPAIAQGGTFNIGMIAMPAVLRSFPGLEFFGTIWFLLLFFAAFTSSVGVAQPVIAFFEDEAKMPRAASAMMVGLFWILGTIPCIFFNRYGAVDELDFWAGTIGLVVFASVEAILFAWVFRMKNGWEELHRGALIRVPRVFFYVLKYVTPVLLIGLFAWWFKDAVANDTLAPTPKVRYAVEDLPQFEGSFSTGAPLPSAEATGEDAARQAKAILARVSDAVQEQERDMFGWAVARIEPDGHIAVQEMQGDPYLLARLDKSTLERLLALQGYHYEPSAGERDAGLASASRPIRLQVEGWHVAPYIWLVRVIIVGVALAFLVMVFAIWRSRAERRAHESAPGTAQEAQP